MGRRQSHKKSAPASSGKLINLALTIDNTCWRAMHLNTAFDRLADKLEQDLRNAAKEAVSAVGSTAASLFGNEKATLGEALRILRGSCGIHPALSAGWEKIYGLVPSRWLRKFSQTPIAHRHNHPSSSDTSR